MTVLFISDLHLSGERPDKVTLFERFLSRAARHCSALFILGDLFELWLGDDDDTPPHPSIIAALARFSDSGVPLYVMRGNHDFLIGERFAGETGARLLGDYHCETWHGIKTLVTHGDLLCTDDVLYQAFRAKVRDAAFQDAFLRRPLAQRRAIAAELRAATRESSAAKPEVIMDVTGSAVEEVMRRHGVTRLIHGHTHRPAMHRFRLGATAAERVVLGAWHGRESVLRLDEGGVSLLPISDFLNQPMA